LKEQAPRFTLERLARIAKRLLETEQQLKQSEGTPLPVELAILDLVTQAQAAPSGIPTPPPARSSVSSAAARPSAAAAPAPVRAAPREVPRSEAATAPAAVPSVRRIEPAAERRPAAAPGASGVIDLASRRAQAALALADVQKAWADFVAQTRAQSVAKAAHLNEAEPLSCDNGIVVIGFVTEFQRALWQDRLRTELEQALSERLSVAVRVRCVVQTVKADAPTASDDPMHRAALEIFRRPDRIMEIE